LKTIWKYNLIAGNYMKNIIEMPKNGEILSVQNQYNEIVLWIKINTNNKTEERRFIIYGTGDNIKFSSENINYIGTVQMDIDVWHVFERLD